MMKVKTPKPEGTRSQKAAAQPPKSRATARDLLPGSPAYVIRELTREPDERIAALESERSQLVDRLLECAKAGEPAIRRVRRSIEICKRLLTKLMKAPDRVCRLLQLRQDRVAFAEWLAEQRRPSPIVRRDGVPIPREEQDGYYQRDYDDWMRTRQDPIEDRPIESRLEAIEETGLWIANLTASVSAKGRTREEACQNVRLLAMDRIREIRLDGPSASNSGRSEPAEH
jgi:hypothetical protein